jgi:hypothetical protein
MTTFDIRRIPFSRYGSYLGISDLGPVADQKADEFVRAADIKSGVWLRAFSGESGRELFRLELLAGDVPVPCATAAEPGALTLVQADGRGRVRIAFAGTDELRISGEGCGLRLTMKPHKYNVVDAIDERRCKIMLFVGFRVIRLAVRAGRLRAVSGDGDRGPHMVLDLLPDESGRLEARFQRCLGQAEVGEPDWTPFDEVAAVARSEFEAFAAPLIRDVPAAYRETAVRAAYVDWSAVVHPEGLYGRPGMLMSKNYMCNIWSWDHAFNALALAPAHPGLAWDQMLIMFDHQLPSGELPDFMNSILKLYNVSKPPVHGWVADWMLRYGPPPGGRATLEEVYERFSKWAGFWLNKQAKDCPLPVQQHGCDGGWDNATVYDGGLPVLTPEISAYLLQLLHFLAGLAGRLGREFDAREWQARAKALNEALLGRLWRHDQFVFERPRDGGYDEGARSLIALMPILAAERFPPAVRAALVRRLRDFLTPWGPATERPDSPRYQPAGYWRGPIWAPSTLIAADGARKAGDPELARDIARRFCNLCHRSGFPENFNALTGEPLCDQAYTWTSSVFLVLAREFLQPGDGPTDSLSMDGRQ